MPRKPIDYSKTVIYKLVHKDDIDNENVYIGSTTDFIKRRYNHKSCCHNQKTQKQKKYQYINENGGWENWVMIEIEKYPCEDFNEASARERYWYEKLKSTLNDKYPQRSTVEYSKHNTEKTQTRCKEWYENNKEHHAEYQKKYRQENREKCSLTEKKWREENAEYRRQQQKEYRDNLPKVKCDCGVFIAKRHLKGHLQTKKHQEKINNNIN